MNSDHLHIIEQIIYNYKQSTRWHDFKASELARKIMAALNKGQKWDSERRIAASTGRECWIPTEDLVAYLNSLPGPPITEGDLMALPLPRWDEPIPEARDECLRVYYREKQAGTAWGAMMEIIQNEAVLPAFDKQHSEQRRLRREGALRRIRSGEEVYGFIEVPDQRDWYSRHDGQLFRLQKLSRDQYALFSVSDLGEEGLPTQPHIFKARSQARDAVAFRRVRLRRRGHGFAIAPEDCPVDSSKSKV
jgi:hypothetical protein